MLDFLASLGAVSLRPFWLPLTAWTLVWLAAEALLRTGAHPLVRYRAAQAALWSLPLGVAAAAVVSAWTASSALPLAFALPLVVTLPEVVVGGAVEPVASQTPWGAVVLGAATLAAGALALGCLARLTGHAVALRRRMHGLTVLDTQRDGRAEVRTVAEAVVPFTVGVLRPVIVLPASLDGPDDDGARRLALAHERVHVRRLDYAARWAEALTASVFAIHPGAARLARHAVALRELACDAAVLEREPDRPAYARLLVAFSPTDSSPVSVAMAARPSSIHQRIEAMKTVRSAPRAPWSVALVLLVVGVLVLTASRPPEAAYEPVASFAADTIERDVPPAPPPPPVPPAPASEVHEIVDDPPELIGGLSGLMGRIAYPSDARDDGIQGTVIVQFIVDEAGVPRDAECARKPDGAEALCEAALTAVLASRFEPGTHRGEPVAVRFSLPVQFRLSNDTDEG